MSEEIKTESAPAPATETAPEAPTDFREYVKWRQSGELPKEPEPTPAAAQEPEPAKSAPQSGAEDKPTAEDEEDVEPGKPGRGSSRVRKIDRLTRENEMLRQQLATAQIKQQPAPVEAPKPPVEPQGKPKLHDFPTLEAYQEALTDWKLDQREAQQKAKAREDEAKAAEEKLQTGFAKSQDSARTLHPDYDDVIQSVAIPQGPGVMAARQAMLEDDAGGEILYHLATHPEELERIAQMQPVSAIREIGRLSATLASPPSPAAGTPKPKISSAPRPPAPLSRPSAGTSKKDIFDDDFAKTDYAGWSKVREAQLKGR